MADKKITQMTELAVTPDVADVFAILDIGESDANKNKKITYANLGVPANTTHRSSDGTDHANVVLNDTHRASDGTDHANVVLNDTHRASDGTDHANVVLNDTHRASDGTDHANVVLNDTHRASDGTDHANVVLNDTHRASDGKDHSDVVLNNTHRASDGTDHANVVLNDTHRGSDGKDHSDVVANNAKISYTDAAAVALNTTHRTSDGKDHSDVVANNAKVSYTDAAAVALNTTHRTSDGSDHTFIDQSVISGATPTFTGTNFTGLTVAGLPASFKNVSIPMPGISGNGFAITTGIKGDFVVPFNCTITGWTLLADQSGSIAIDLWKDTYANFPPTDADSIVVPSITTALKNQATGLSIAASKGDIIRTNVDSITDIEKLAWSLEVTRL